MKAVFMAGGKGTRISSVYSDIPKPMIKVGGKPVLEHEIECLREQGIRDIIITTGHLGEKIREYFGDGSGISPASGRPFGVNIEYCHEEQPLGNAGALFRIRDRLTEDFLLLNADMMFDIDTDRFIDFHRRAGGLVTLFAHPNSHPKDSGLLITGDSGEVERWLAKEDERPEYYRNCVNAGLHIISPKLLDRDIQTKKVDLDRQILKPLCGTGKMFCYMSPEYVKDMGTPERYETVCKDFYKGKIRTGNLRHKQKAVFLDRDGTINRYVGFLKSIEDFELLPGVAEAIREINESGYLAIVVTNQPVIARGEITREQLREIHNKMETLLAREGAYIDAIYYCPHHPDRGYEGEIAELKTDCECRKPKPGLLLKAAEDYNIDLSSSWMAGDSRRDIEAGKAAGCKTVLVENTAEFGQTYTYANLLDFANTCLKE